MGLKLNIIASIATLMLILATASLNAKANKPTATAAHCDNFMQAFTIWEDEENGKVVEKRSYFKIDDWNPDSQFDGLIVNKPLQGKSQKLELEFTSTDKKTHKKVAFDNLTPPDALGRRQFEGFNPSDVLKVEHPGNFIIRLKSDGRTLCEERHRVHGSGD